jgi:hypothetical protein
MSKVAIITSEEVILPKGFKLPGTVRKVYIVDSLENYDFSKVPPENKLLNFKTISEEESQQLQQALHAYLAEAIKNKMDDQKEDKATAMASSEHLSIKESLIKPRSQHEVARDADKVGVVNIRAFRKELDLLIAFNKQQSISWKKRFETEEKRQEEVKKQRHIKDEHFFEFKKEILNEDLHKDQKNSS